MNYPAAPGGSAKIYVANPFGFSEAGRKFILEVILPELGKHGQAVDPFQLIDPKRIANIESMLAAKIGYGLGAF